MAVRKRSGFKDGRGNFWINERGKHGVRYQCKGCGRVTLGWRGANDRSHHFEDSCPVLLQARGDA